MTAQKKIGHQILTAAKKMAKKEAKFCKHFLWTLLCIENEQRILNVILSRNFEIKVFFLDLKKIFLD